MESKVERGDGAAVSDKDERIEELFQRARRGQPFGYRDDLNMLLGVICDRMSSRLYHRCLRKTRSPECPRMASSESESYQCDVNGSSYFSKIRQLHDGQDEIMPTNVGVEDERTSTDYSKRTPTSFSESVGSQMEPSESLGSPIHFINGPVPDAYYRITQTTSNESDGSIDSSDKNSSSAKTSKNMKDRNVEEERVGNTLQTLLESDENNKLIVCSPSIESAMRMIKRNAQDDNYGNALIAYQDANGSKQQAALDSPTVEDSGFLEFKKSVALVLSMCDVDGYTQSDLGIYQPLDVFLEEALSYCDESENPAESGFHRILPDSYEDWSMSPVSYSFENDMALGDVEQQNYCASSSFDETGVNTGHTKEKPELSDTSETAQPSFTRPEYERNAESKVMERAKDGSGQTENDRMKKDILQQSLQNRSTWSSSMTLHASDFLGQEQECNRFVNSSLSDIHCGLKSKQVPQTESPIVPSKNNSSNSSKQGNEIHSEATTDGTDANRHDEIHYPPNGLPEVQPSKNGKEYRAGSTSQSVFDEEDKAQDKVLISVKRVGKCIWPDNDLGALMLQKAGTDRSDKDMKGEVDKCTKYTDSFDTRMKDLLVRVSGNEGRTSSVLLGMANTIMNEVEKDEEDIPREVDFGQRSASDARPGTPQYQDEQASIDNDHGSLMLQETGTDRSDKDMKGEVDKCTKYTDSFDTRMKDLLVRVSGNEGRTSSVLLGMANTIMNEVEKDEEDIPREVDFGQKSAKGARPGTPQYQDEQASINNDHGALILQEEGTVRSNVENVDKCTTDTHSFDTRTGSTSQCVFDEEDKAQDKVLISVKRVGKCIWPDNDLGALMLQKAGTDRSDKDMKEEVDKCTRMKDLLVRVSGNEKRTCSALLGMANTIMNEVEKDEEDIPREVDFGQRSASDARTGTPQYQDEQASIDNDHGALMLQEAGTDRSDKDMKDEVHKCTKYTDSFDTRMKDLLVRVSGNEKRTCSALLGMANTIMNEVEKDEEDIPREVDFGQRSASDARPGTPQYQDEQASIDNDHGALMLQEAGTDRSDKDMKDEVDTCTKYTDSFDTRMKDLLVRVSGNEKRTCSALLGMANTIMNEVEKDEEDTCIPTEVDFGQRSASDARPGTPQYQDEQASIDNDHGALMLQEAGTDRSDKDMKEKVDKLTKVSDSFDTRMKDLLVRVSGNEKRTCSALLGMANTIMNEVEKDEEDIPREVDFGQRSASDARPGTPQYDDSEDCAAKKGESALKDDQVNLGSDQDVQAKVSMNSTCAQTEKISNTQICPATGNGINSEENVDEDETVTSKISCMDTGCGSFSAFPISRSVQAIFSVRSVAIQSDVDPISTPLNDDLDTSPDITSVKVHTENYTQTSQMILHEEPSTQSIPTQTSHTLMSEIVPNGQANNSVRSIGIQSDVDPLFTPPSDLNKSEETTSIKAHAENHTQTSQMVLHQDPSTQSIPTQTSHSLMSEIIPHSHPDNSVRSIEIQSDVDALLTPLDDDLNTCKEVTSIQDHAENYTQTSQICLHPAPSTQSIRTQTSHTLMSEIIPNNQAENSVRSIGIQSDVGNLLTPPNDLNTSTEITPNQAHEENYTQTSQIFLHPEPSTQSIWTQTSHTLRSQIDPNGQAETASKLNVAIQSDHDSDDSITRNTKDKIRYYQRSLKSLKNKLLGQNDSFTSESKADEPSQVGKVQNQSPTSSSLHSSAAFPEPFTTDGASFRPMQPMSPQSYRYSHPVLKYLHAISNSEPTGPELAPFKKLDVAAMKASTRKESNFPQQYEDQNKCYDPEATNYSREYVPNAVQSVPDEDTSKTKDGKGQTMPTQYEEYDEYYDWEMSAFCELHLIDVPKSLSRKKKNKNKNKRGKQSETSALEYHQGSQVVSQPVDSRRKDETAQGGLKNKAHISRRQTGVHNKDHVSRRQTGVHADDRREGETRRSRKKKNPSFHQGALNQFPPDHEKRQTSRHKEDSVTRKARYFEDTKSATVNEAKEKSAYEQRKLSSVGEKNTERLVSFYEDVCSVS